MSARVCGAFSQVMQSGQRSSTSTTSEPLASQRSGCRKVDPQRGHIVMAATSPKLRVHADGTAAESARSRSTPRRLNSRIVGILAPMSVEERPFDVRWEQRDAGVVVIASGEIDLWSAPEVRAALTDPRDERPRRRAGPARGHVHGLERPRADRRAAAARAQARLPVRGRRRRGADAHRILEMSGLTKVLDVRRRSRRVPRRRRADVDGSAARASATRCWPAARSAATCSPSTGRRHRSARPSSGRGACRPSSRSC